jgi:dephospho-CoA kinase
VSARQVRVLLTGGIGAGKSSVGELLRAHGALVIDADEIGHSVLAPDGEAFKRVAETWPSVVVDEVIDRGKLADIVFHHPDQLERLEAFTHDAIRRRIVELIASSIEPVVVVEVPLLTHFMGPGWLRVVVDADPEVRFERLLRRGMDADDVKRRMSAQPDRVEWTACADIVIGNSDDQGSLESRIDALWERLKSRRIRASEDPDCQ